MIKPERKLLYFGCIKEKGHFLWNSESWHHYYDQMAKEIPGLNPNVLRHLDGVYAPYDPHEREGLYLESTIPPVRIVAWWDRSVDKRMACNSAFIGFGYDSAEEILDDAVSRFPSVMSRQPRPVPAVNG